MVRLESGPAENWCECGNLNAIYQYCCMDTITTQSPAPAAIRASVQEVDAAIFVAQRVIYGMLRRRLPDAHDDLLQDLRQECWIRLTKSLHSYNPAHGAKLQTYLHRSTHWAVTRVVHSYIRQQIVRRESIGHRIPLRSNARVEHPPTGEQIDRAATLVREHPEQFFTHRQAEVLAVYFSNPDPSYTYIAMLLNRNRQFIGAVVDEARARLGELDVADILANAAPDKGEQA